MLRKTTFLQMGMIMAILLFGCTSPTGPGPHGPHLKEYRDRVEVTYTRVMPLAAEHLQRQEVNLVYQLYDPNGKPSTDWLGTSIPMSVSYSGNGFVAYLEHVFIQTEKDSSTHWIQVHDYKLANVKTGIQIDVKGAISWERLGPESAPTAIRFKMGRH